MTSYKHLLTHFILLCAISSIAKAGEDQTRNPGLRHGVDDVPEGLSKSDWQSIRAAYEAGRHAFMPVEGGWQARNPGQQWTTKFDGRGFIAQPRGADWEWGFELKSYGFLGQERSVGGAESKPEVSANGQRLTYAWDDTVQEWFVNDTRGLEHGFTVKQRPAGAGEAPLQFDLAVRGTLVAQVAADGQGVEFRDASGATVLNYTGLKVWDADGKVLNSRFVLRDVSLRLLVDESGARYPLTIDPIAQQAYLKPDNNGPAFDNNFGYSVAVSGETVVIGAPREDSSTEGVNSTPDENATDSGAAYVFTRSGTIWSQQAYLKASNTGTGDSFGISVAVEGDTVVVGAWAEDSSSKGVNTIPTESALGSGAAYVFVRSGSAWSQQAYLKASNTGASDQFGISVAISENTVLVGAYGEDSNASGVNGFGTNNDAGDSGAAYVFVRNGSTWTQQAYLKASNTGSSDQFGYSVALSGDTAVIGAYGEDSNTSGVNALGTNNNASSSGAAYVFVRNGSTWTQQAYLKASNIGVGDWFGYSLAVSGNTVVVGAPNEASGTTGVDSVSDEQASFSGAAYVFTRSGTSWNQPTYLKASNTEAGDQFGTSVSVSGNAVIVGSPYEDSNSTGVNSTPNEVGSASGAAYVFVRSGTMWSQQGYLKASNTGVSDYFGVSVAASGNTVLVGAFGEASDSTGVDSTPNEGALGSGAAYLFNLNISSATQGDITLRGNGQGISDEDVTPDWADHTDFGTVAMNNAQKTRIFTIGNEGGGVLSLIGTPAAAVIGAGARDFKVTAVPHSPVASGGTTTFEVTFDPKSLGLSTATVSIGSDDPEDDLFSFNVSGFGALSGPLSQTISFTAPGTVYLGQSSVALNANATSGLPITFSVESGPATITGNTLTLRGIGTVRVKATQAGGGDYKAAAPVTRLVAVKSDPTVLTLINLNQPYDGLPKPVATLGTMDSVTLRYKVGGSFGSSAPSNAGSYIVEAVAGAVTRTGTLVITKAPLYITPDNKRKFAGQPNPVLTLSASGFQGADTAAGVLTSPLVLSTTAKINSPGGFYSIKSRGGAAANYALFHQQGVLNVESFAGPYEALLVDGAALPVGKLNLTVASSSKSFTGKLFTASAATSLSISGAVITDSDLEQGTGTTSVTRNGVRYDVTFTMPLNGALTASVTRDSVFESYASDGCKLLVLPSNEKVIYSGASTAVLKPALPVDDTVPVGAGWALGTTSSKGLLTLKGKLGDGTAFTAALSPDGEFDPGYRLFVQPYMAARSGAYLAGSFRHVVTSSAVGSREMRGVAGAPLTWVKVGLPSDSSYRTSFGSVTTMMTLDPWLKPAGSDTLAVRMGLISGTFGVQYSDTGSLSGPNLPFSVALSAKNVVSVLLPQTAPPNITKWKTTINASLGTFTGSFELLDLTEKRTVPFSGVLRQPPSSADTLIGDGHFLLPALKTATSNEKVSGEIMFLR